MSGIAQVLSSWHAALSPTPVVRASVCIDRIHAVLATMIGLDIIALAGSSTTSLGVTMDVISAANRLAERALFDTRVLSPDAPRVRLREGASVEARAIASARSRDPAVGAGR